MANLVNVRIDDRLIHGQVASWWSTKLNIQRIIVANDKVAANDTQKMALRMSVPSNCSSSIINLATTVENLRQERYGDQRIMLITNCPQDLEWIINQGIELDEINVGNLSNREGTFKIAKSIYISEDERESFLNIHDAGVKLINQMTPDDKKNIFINEIETVNF